MKFQKEIWLGFGIQFINDGDSVVVIDYKRQTFSECKLGEIRGNVFFCYFEGISYSKADPYLALDSFLYRYFFKYNH